MPRPLLQTPIGRRVLFGALYLSEGAPIGYLWWAMPTKLRAAGMPVEDVAALAAALAIPWALKFIWAPAVDALRGPRWGLRMWITSAQLMMGLLLMPLLVLPLEENLDLVKWLLLAHAFSAATQDVAIDALAVRTVPHAERGRINGWMQVGMLTGRAAFGGAALWLESQISQQFVIGMLIGCVWGSMILLWFGGSTPIAAAQSLRSAARQFADHLAATLRLRATWLGLGIAAIAGAGFEAVGGLVGPFLIDSGLTEEKIGAFLALPVIGCMIGGALLGGWAADRVGHRKLVASAVVAIAVWTVVIATLARAGPAEISELVMLSVLAALYVLIGVLTASSYALFMDLTDPQLGGTQFSAFMGATNLCEIWAVAAAGKIVTGASYSTAFVVLAMASLAALPLIFMLPDRRTGESALA